MTGELSRIYIGLDPGTGGGLAALTADGKVVHAQRMPETPRDVLDALRFMCPAPERARAVLEFVRSSPQMGVVSAFTFGCGYGGLRMALAAVGIAYEEATPQKWRKALGCSSQRKKFGERDATEAKNVTKAKAQQLFPFAKVTHAVADALLIAEYARRTDQGSLL